MQPDPKGNNTGWWSRIRAEIWPLWSTCAVGLLLAARACMSAVRALAGVIVPIYLAVIGYKGRSLYAA
jgi:hypothetical protein